MKRFIIATVGVVLLAGCAAQQPATTGLSNGVAAAEIALTSAEKTALIYTKLPRCPAASLCSTQAAVDKIKAADNTAFIAVQAARTNEALLGAALTAIQTLTASIPAT